MRCRIGYIHATPRAGEYPALLIAGGGREPLEQMTQED